MKAHARLKADERRVYIEQAAGTLGLSALIVEKDFWVCWALDVLFAGQAGQEIVFKGGTSLSKVFGVIRRFSEDIDISVSPQVLGVDESQLEREGLSKTKIRAAFSELQASCREHVRTQILPRLEDSARADLGMATSSHGTWFQLDPQLADDVVVWLSYPSVLPEPGGYVEKRVKLEFGSLTGQQPNGTWEVHPMLHEALPKSGIGGTTVTALAVERTFWEKATILHAEYHRDIGTPMAARHARHYSDFASLWQRRGPECLLRADLLADVARHKQRYFASAWTQYETARRGTLRILPQASRFPELRNDLRLMAPMFFDTPPDLKDMLATLREAEAAMNEAC